MGQRDNLFTALNFYWSEGPNRTFLPSCPVGARLNELTASNLPATQVALLRSAVARPHGCLDVSNCISCSEGEEALDAMICHVLGDSVLPDHVRALIRLYRPSGGARRLLAGCPTGDALTALIVEHKGRASLGMLVAEIAGDYQCVDRLACIGCEQGRDLFVDSLFDLSMHGLDGETGNLLRKTGAVMTL